MTIYIGDKSHQIRLSGTIEDPYFCGKDVCKVLGYKNTKDAISKHVKSRNKKNLENYMKLCLILIIIWMGS